MIRSLTVATLIVAFVPACLTADPGDGGSLAGGELATYCSSPTMDYCMKVASWEVQAYPDDGFPYVVVRWTSTFFGEGYAPGGEYQPNIEMWLEGAPGRFGAFPSSHTIWGPSTIEMADGQGVGSQGDPYSDWLQSDPFVAFVSWNDLSTDPSSLPCTTQEYIDRVWPGADGFRTCYRVPEPPTYLLLASGMLGLGILGWRRRRGIA